MNLIESFVKIINKDIKLSYNKILAKAEAVINMVYIADDDENSLETFETKIPVMGFIDVDGLSEDMEISLDYCIKCFNIKTTILFIRRIKITTILTIT